MPPDQFRPPDLRFTGIRVRHGHNDDPHGACLAVDDLTVAGGAHLGISGASGSGKSTLLHLVAGLLRAREGSVRWGAQDVSRLAEAARDDWRRRTVGFVFQEFHLIPELDVIGNILLPMTFGRGSAGKPGRADAELLASRLGVTMFRKPAGLLSRGEQQRVAVARALLHRPELILADEPTASLDVDNADAVGVALVEEARRIGATLLCVSHDPALLARMGSRLHLVNGQIT